MKNEIEKAIKAILVIKNPESIWRAVDRITSIVERDQALNTSSVSDRRELLIAFSKWWNGQEYSKDSKELDAFDKYYSNL